MIRVDISFLFSPSLSGLIVLYHLHQQTSLPLLRGGSSLDDDDDMDVQDADRNLNFDPKSGKQGSVGGNRETADSGDSGNDRADGDGSDGAESSEGSEVFRPGYRRGGGDASLRPGGLPQTTADRWQWL